MIVSNFSRVLHSSQEKSKTMVMQNLGDKQVNTQVKLKVILMQIVFLSVFFFGGRVGGGGLNKMHHGQFESGE